MIYTFAMPLSNRHHYIPQFILKGFANSDGKLAVYDRKTKRLWKNPASTKQVFFEYGRNTFDIKGNTTDFIEGLYQYVDDNFATVYQRLTSGDGFRNPSTEDMIQLGMFTGLLYWRVPNTDAENAEYVKSSDLEKLRIKICDKSTGAAAPADVSQQIKNEPAFIEAYRMGRPLMDMLRAAEKFDPGSWHISQSANGQGKSLIGDNPLILLNGGLGNIFKEHLIMPLSSNHSVQHLPGSRLNQIQPKMMITIDLLTFLQAELYVCGNDPGYLMAIASMAAPLEEKPHLVAVIQAKLFAELLNDNNIS
ncbi:DUF4238 domain-containing protein [Mucilaginibacter sabulilitoris]|uniref:DUF4238 domain-containing protein n=1 Tax=Mucilaginibacter sabulilitoris TaxID=1173583 RepID=A0ABZ0TW88_9SPHI|nr:DUF4238 domain-containing protein [Mucilaginibacter sabulilitoris]WPU96413.1 DUF4238 domain-containing protein [Mucilaginibacter sabulilitoris]